jgi:hypothetical protein
VTILIVVAAALIVFVIAAVVVGREAHRLDARSPSANGSPPTSPRS